MKRDKNPMLDAMGRAIEQEQNQELLARSELDEREDMSSFLAAVDALPKEKAAPSQRLSFALAASMAVLAVGIGVLFFTFFVQESGDFSVNGQVGNVGEVVTTDQNTTTLIDFPDGSEMRLNANSTAQVLKLDGGHVEIALQSGDAYLDVVHTPETNWTLRAGPFRIRVTGTAFQVKWDAPSQTFELKMTEGSVRVDGPSLPPDYRLSNRDNVVLQLTEDDPSVEVDTAAEPEETTALTSPDVPEKQKVVPRASQKRKSQQPLTWQSLAKEQKYKEALQLAEESGFDKLCKQLDGGSLLKLADVSRFAGNPKRTEQSLLAIRKRFPGSRHGTTAAYLLGHTAFGARKLKNAEHWYHLYLKETPSGSLASEALGRVLEIQHRQGRRGQSRATAEDYLKRFPNGAHGDLARQILK